MDKLGSRKYRNSHLGFGLGLRKEYYETILEDLPDLDWFEILSETFMADGGKPLYYLDQIRARYPVVMHGVSLSIGGTGPLDQDYLNALKQLADRAEPAWISDHLCWTAQGGDHLHDILPMPYSEKAIEHVVCRIGQVQDYLGRQILIENVSTGPAFIQDEMAEWEFLREIADHADCLILLDINDIHVSACNHGFEPTVYLKALPGHRVRQFHLAGHSNHGHYIIATHDHPVSDPVWRLYQAALDIFGPVSTMIERDGNMPPLAELLDELDRARALAAPAFGIPEEYLPT